MFYVLFCLLALVAVAEVGFLFYLRRKAKVTALRNEESRRLYAEALAFEREAKERHEFSEKLAASVAHQGPTGPRILN